MAVKQQKASSSSLSFAITPCCHHSQRNHPPPAIAAAKHHPLSSLAHITIYPYCCCNPWSSIRWKRWWWKGGVRYVGGLEQNTTVNQLTGTSHLLCSNPMGHCHPSLSNPHCCPREANLQPIKFIPRCC